MLTHTVGQIVNEGTEEFNELIGNPVAILSDTNLANDDEANERIQVVEYKPDSTKYALIFDIGNGEWNLYALVDKRDVIIFPELVAKRLAEQQELNDKLMENVIEYPKKLSLNLYGNNWVIVNTWKDQQGVIHNTVASGVYANRERCEKECNKRNNLPHPNGNKFSIRLINCDIRKVN